MIITRQRLNIFAMITFGAFIILGATGEITAVANGLWTDEDVNDTISQANTSKFVCIGPTCYDGWELTITANASINNSEICTEGNGLCSSVISGNGSVNGSEGNIQYRKGNNFDGTDSLNWTGTELVILGTLDVNDELIYDGTRLILGGFSSTAGVVYFGNETGASTQSAIHGDEAAGFVRIFGGAKSYFFDNTGWRVNSGDGYPQIIADRPNDRSSLFRVQNSDSGMGYFSSSGNLPEEVNFNVNGEEVLRMKNLSAGIDEKTEFLSGIIIDNHLATTQALLIQGETGQSEYILEIQSSSGTMLLAIDANGKINMTNGGTIHDNSTCVIITSPGGTEYPHCD